MNSEGEIRILTTGFGPYPGVEMNASQWLAESLGQERPPAPGVTTAAAVLPVAWNRAADHALAWIESFRPDVVLHFGVAPSARSIRVEAFARNQTVLLPDMGGALPPAPWARSGAPSRLRAVLAGPLLVHALRRRRIPARLSEDAGAYLCNFVFFRSLHWASRQKRAPLVGFFHVPPVTDEADVSAAMSVEELMMGGRLILRHALALARRRSVR